MRLLPLALLLLPAAAWSNDWVKSFKAAILGGAKAQAQADRQARVAMAPGPDAVPPNAPFYVLSARTEAELAAACAPNRLVPKTRAQFPPEAVVQVCRRGQAEPGYEYDLLSITEYVNSRVLEVDYARPLLAAACRERAADGDGHLIGSYQGISTHLQSHGFWLCRFKKKA